MKLPNGIILQWGLSDASVNGHSAVTFPITFPNSVFNLIGNTSNNNTLYVMSVALYQLQTNGGDFLITAIYENAGTLHRDGTVNGARVWWLAVGY